jgi:ribosomal 30S subunit maturation factor RimM
VLVVRREQGAGGLREQLIPFADAVVLAVDLAAGTMDVDWDRDY